MYRLGWVRHNVILQAIQSYKSDIAAYITMITQPYLVSTISY